MPSPLALLGGTPAVPPDAVRPWPPTGPRDEERVLDALHSGVHAWGAHCEALQAEWASWNGNRFCMATNSGTAALHMALAACGAGAGDEVLTPAYSWTSSVSCILHHNAIPVFVDVEPTWANIDPARIEEAITPLTKAILIVHLHGVPADMEAIAEIAARHGLAVVEDCCQAHGALHQGRKVGTLGDCAAFSLNQNKMLCAGEGGLFVTDDAARLERGRALALFGDFRRPPYDEGEAHYGLGWMYRCNELNAAFARAQLERLDENIAHARRLFGALRERLAGVPGLVLPTEPEWAAENGYNFVCHVDPEGVGYAGPANVLREAVVCALAAEGVPAMVWQRRVLPEMAAVRSRNAYGGGSPWRESGSTVRYDPARFPMSLYHSATYFIVGGLRLPNTVETAGLIADAVLKVFRHLPSLDIDAVGHSADVSLYERGWRRHRAD
ncbi:MAG: DegT/DnrJ/EryC1/StrS family aminotransferase [Chthonomonadales bacterium]|nr:DegT/DnrJ/EryC1/StrS family aminotransferase [Chthonomonadales bacterium]